MNVDRRFTFIKSDGGEVVKDYDTRKTTSAKTVPGFVKVIGDSPKDESLIHFL